MGKLQIFPQRLCLVNWMVSFLLLAVGGTHHHNGSHSLLGKVNPNAANRESPRNSGVKKAGLVPSK